MVSQSELVDVPPWRPEHLIGGHPALDLVNTIAHRLNPELALDRMDMGSKIASWCSHQGLLSKRDEHDLTRLCQAPDTEAALVSATAELRDAAARIFDAVAAGQHPPPDAVAQVLAASAHGQVEVMQIPDSYRHACRLRLLEVSVETVVASIALQVVDAVFRLPGGRVRACPRCGWLFCDTSKGGRRKWCSMRDCGNREKVARHYRAKRGR